MTPEQRAEATIAAVRAAGVEVIAGTPAPVVSDPAGQKHNSADRARADAASAR
jgi:hypothetical protein